MPISTNTNSFLVQIRKEFMSRTIYIREIITILKEPKLCPTCQKNDRLEKNIVMERRSNGQTILCTRCEALTIITNHNLREVELASEQGNKIMLKEPHLIRKVTY
jgi:hypothetical protein